MITRQMNTLARVARSSCPKPHIDRSVTGSDLLQDALLKLFRSERHWSNTSGFRYAAIMTIKRIVIDVVRKRRTNKRRHTAVSIDTAVDIPERAQSMPIDQALDLREAMAKLSASDPKMAAVLEMCLAGATERETSRHFRVSLSTVQRWKKALRVWLCDELDLAEDAEYT